ncbi:MAG TPA: hypothetical protein VI356_14590 [Myxococcales bacterium]
MRKLLSLPLVAAIACGGGQFKDQARDAMPSKDTMSMGSPQRSQAVASSPGTDAVAQDSSVGQSSPFFGVTVTAAATFNVPVAAFLDLLQHVTEDFEPTSCTTSSCTWQGSGALDANVFKLVVSRDADGVSFDWTLSGQPKAQPTSAFVEFASGVATPGGQRHHGSGSFSIDFDQEALLGAAGNATGKLQVTHYTNVGPAQLEVTYLGATASDPPGSKNNILYKYANDTAGGGDLDFALHNTTSGDRFSVHSRWKNDGQGRADVQGLGGSNSVTISECWGSAPFNVVYFNSNITLNLPPWGGPTSGSVSACAYADASFSAKTAP